VELAIFDHDQLEQVCLAPFMVDRRDGSGARFHGERTYHEPFGPRVEGGLKLYGPARHWKPLAGRDPLASLPRSPDAFRWLWSWLELQYAWKCAFRTCANPESPYAAYFCTKMVAEPARVWLWLAAGRAPPAGIDAVLQAALRAMPEEESTLRSTVALLRSLPGPAEAPVAESLALLCRVSARIAERVAEATVHAGATPVALGVDGDGDATRTYRLADWRACVLGDAFEDEFVLVDGAPDDARALAAVARSSYDGPNLALRRGSLLVFPTARGGLWPLARTALRGIQCPASDPVSFALVDGHRVAEFPELPGWSARERARRAALEHKAWLAAEDAAEPDPRRRLGMLFSAARAALFAQSVAAGEAWLPLSPAAIVAGLDGSARAVAETAHEEYEATRANGTPPSASTLAAFRRVVEPRLGAG
jgi:hypothetical protein